MALHNLTDEHFNGAYMSISQVVDYFNFYHFPKINILKTKEHFQQLPFCIYFRKHSTLIASFNKQIAAYTSSGLINFWASAYITVVPNKNADIEMQAKKLSLNQINGVIIVSGCLILLSTIVFIFEVISMKYDRVKQYLDFFTFDLHGLN